MNDAVIKAAPPDKPARPAGSCLLGLSQDIAGLDTTLGLSRMLGKKTLYLAMLRRYVASQKGVCAQIHQALAALIAALEVQLSAEQCV